MGLTAALLLNLSYWSVFSEEKSALHHQNYFQEVKHCSFWWVNSWLVKAFLWKVLLNLNHQYTSPYGLSKHHVTSVCLVHDELEFHLANECLWTFLSVHLKEDCLKVLHELLIRNLVSSYCPQIQYLPLLSPYQNESKEITASFSFLSPYHLWQYQKEE